MIAILNVVVLIGILRVFARMRRGDFDETELEQQLENRGLLNRFLGRFTRSITKSWHMYPVGLLFGLGFDTATEIALLVLAGTSAAAGLPWYAILCLPVLFTAGMCLLDTIDGSFMNFAYGWAFSNPVRKIYYNITITGLSVAVALLIGSIELLGLFAGQLGWHGRPWDWLGGLDLNTVGFVVVGMFVGTWAIALLVWRYGRIEEKWTRRNYGVYDNVLMGAQKRVQGDRRCMSCRCVKRSPVWSRPTPTAATSTSSGSGSARFVRWYPNRCRSAGHSSGIPRTCPTRSWNWSASAPRCAAGRAASSHRSPRRGRSGVRGATAPTSRCCAANEFLVTSLDVS